jgi:hypothetical protein
MTKRRAILCCVMVGAALGMLGCSTHPLPQDVSGVPTADIVKKIRCEAKDGLEEALAKAASLGEASRKHAERIVSVSTIGFEFKFVMSEDNSAVVSELTFERPSAGGDLFKLTLVGSIAADPAVSDKTNKLSRTNIRTFRVIDKLEDLHKAHCGRVKGTEPNPIYPITGSTGMAEVVRTYIELEIFTNLTNAPPPTGKKEIITFSDKLDFTTTFSAGASVDFKFSTTVGTLRLTKASASGSAYRQDYHSVTVALARDFAVNPDVAPEGPGGAARQMVVPMGSINRQVGFLPVEAIRDKDVREGLAKRGSLARNRVLLELDRRRRVDEDRNVAQRVLGQPVP